MDLKFLEPVIMTASTADILQPVDGGATCHCSSSCGAGAGGTCSCGANCGGGS